MADYKYTFDLEPIKKPSRFKGGLGVPDAPEEQDDDRSAVIRMYDILAGYFSDEDEAKKALAPIKPMPDEGYLDQMLKTLEGIKVPADQETPILDELQGQDVDSTEDATEAQAKRIQDSAVTTFKAPESAGLMAKPSVADGVQPTDGKDFEERLANRIMELEGFIPEAEQAFANEKYYTIGYGTYGPQVKKGQTITKKEAEVLLKETELPKRIKAAQDMFDNFDNFSDDLKIELIQGMYRGDFKKTHKTVQLINEGKWEEASKEFLNHKEYKTAKELGDKSDRPGIVPRLEAISAAIYKEQFV